MNVKDEITISGHSVYHDGRKPTLTDIGASPSNHNHDSVYLKQGANPIRVSNDDYLGYDDTTNKFYRQSDGNTTKHYLYDTENKPSKGDIGLANVQNVGLNWSWGTQNPTHIWGSQGDSTQSYVYNGSQLKSFVGLSNVANYGVSNNVNDTSTTTYATSGAVKKAYDKGVEAYNLANNRGLKSVQRGVLNQRSTTTNPYEHDMPYQDVSIGSVNMSKSYVLITSSSELSNSTYRTANARLVNSTTLRIYSSYKNGTGTFQAHTICWQVIEAY